MCVCVCGNGGWLRGEEGKLEQLAALSRTHQGEIERGREKREEEESRRESVEEMRRKGRMEGWMRERGRD